MNKSVLLASISEQISKFRRYSLWKETTNAVYGEGNPNTKVVFIGEGPGYNEYRLGRPFVTIIIY